MSDTMRPANPVPRSASRTVMDSHGRTRGHVRPPWAAGRCPFDVGLRRASSGLIARTGSDARGVAVHVKEDHSPDRSSHLLGPPSGHPGAQGAAAPPRAGSGLGMLRSASAAPRTPPPLSGSAAPSASGATRPAASNRQVRADLGIVLVKAAERVATRSRRIGRNSPRTAPRRPRPDAECGRGQPELPTVARDHDQLAVLGSYGKARGGRCPYDAAPRRIQVSATYTP